jgi:formate--tetrahydrofolate ligase
MITAASELMAILCLASDLADLKTRLARLVIGIDTEGNHITLAALEAVGAIMVLLRNAFWPNLVQTTEGVPTLIHGGPFANIAHGCNSVVATKTALKLADYVITEAGFGADLGAEKFCHIKCRQAKLQPDAVVLVVTCRALKYNGGGIKKNLEEVDMATLEVGMCNMVRHLENLAKFNLNPLVALNRFAFDAPEEITMVENYCRKLNVSFSVCEAYNKGGVGAMDLAKKISEALDINNNKSLKFLYDMKLPLKNKVEILAKDIYRAKKVIFTPKAIGKLKQYTEAGFGQFPVCIAKTQYSFSDDSTLLGAPENFTFTVEDANLAAGAGFVVCLAGNIMTMPGLPKLPNALHMDLTDDGDIEGLLQ